jgi:hypothetical protein
MTGAAANIHFFSKEISCEHIPAKIRQTGYHRNPCTNCKRLLEHKHDNGISTLQHKIIKTIFFLFKKKKKKEKKT